MTDFTHYKIEDKHLIELVMGFMGLPTGISVGINAKQVICSICADDYRKCNHIENEEYDGKTAHRIVKKFDVDHLSLVKNPRIPDCGIDVLSLPKKIVEKYLTNYIDLEQLEKESRDDPNGMFIKGIAFKANA